MIVVDNSALCAVFFNEPEKSAFQAILDGDERWFRLTAKVIRKMAQHIRPTLFFPHIGAVTGPTRASVYRETITTAGMQKTR
jgi:uncharacterized protein with PIN domain